MTSNTTPICHVLEACPRSCLVTGVGVTQSTNTKRQESWATSESACHSPPSGSHDSCPSQGSQDWGFFIASAQSCKPRHLNQVKAQRKPMDVINRFSSWDTILPTYGPENPEKTSLPQHTQHAVRDGQQIPAQLERGEVADRRRLLLGSSESTSEGAGSSIRVQAWKVFGFTGWALSSASGVFPSLGTTGSSRLQRSSSLGRPPVELGCALTSCPR